MMELANAQQAARDVLCRDRARSASRDIRQTIPGVGQSTDGAALKGGCHPIESLLPFQEGPQHPGHLLVLLH
jgi:hypothetical protein